MKLEHYPYFVAKFIADLIPGLSRVLILVKIEANNSPIKKCVFSPDLFFGRNPSPQRFLLPFKSYVARVGSSTVIAIPIIIGSGNPLNIFNI